MLPVADLNRRSLYVRWTAGRRTGPDQTGEPVRVRLGARRVMDSEEAAARLHVRLQAGLLLRVEHIAATGQKDDGVVLAELLAVGEDGGVVGGDGLEPAGLRPGEPDLLDRRDSGVYGRDSSVAEAWNTSTLTLAPPGGEGRDNVVARICGPGSG